MRLARFDPACYWLGQADDRVIIPIIRFGGSLLRNILHIAASMTYRCFDRRVRRCKPWTVPTPRHCNYTHVLAIKTQPDTARLPGMASASWPHGTSRDRDIYTINCARSQATPRRLMPSPNDSRAKVLEIEYDADVGAAHRTQYWA